MATGKINLVRRPKPATGQMMVGGDLACARVAYGVVNGPAAAFVSQPVSPWCLQQVLSNLLGGALVEVSSCAKEDLFGGSLLAIGVFERGEFYAARIVSNLLESVIGRTTVFVNDNLHAQNVFECRVKDARNLRLPVVVIDLYLVKGLEEVELSGESPAFNINNAGGIPRPCLPSLTRRLAVLYRIPEILVKTTPALNEVDPATQAKGDQVPMNNSLVTYEQALLTDIELLQKRAARGEVVRAGDVTALLARYGTSFGALPRYLQAAINRIDLAD